MNRFPFLIFENRRNSNLILGKTICMKSSLWKYIFQLVSTVDNEKSMHLPSGKTKLYELPKLIIYFHPFPRVVIEKINYLPKLTNKIGMNSPYGEFIFLSLVLSCTQVESVPEQWEFSRMGHRVIVPGLSWTGWPRGAGRSWTGL